MKLIGNLLAIGVLPTIILQVSTIALAGASNLPKKYVIAKSNEHPWLVSVRKNEQHVCAGSIVSEKLVLTATSCTEERSLRLLTVRAGSFSIYSGGSVHDVVGAVRFRNDSMSPKPSVHNLALLKVRPAFEIDQNIEITRLASKGRIVTPRSVVTTYGWGWMTTVLLMRLRITDLCASPTLGEQFCAIPIDEGSIKSDVGGPLIMDGELVGVLAVDSERNVPIMPKIYTKVSAYRDWIDMSSRALGSLNV